MSPKSYEHEPSELLQMGFLSALVIFLHNIPEGLATFMNTIANPHAGAAVAFAVALHNIPEASQTRKQTRLGPHFDSLPLTCLACHTIPSTVLSTPMSCAAVACRPPTPICHWRACPVP
jgi:hypothetical protein